MIDEVQVLQEAFGLIWKQLRDQLNQLDQSGVFCRFMTNESVLQTNSLMNLVRNSLNYLSDEILCQIKLNLLKENRNYCSIRLENWDGSFVNVPHSLVILFKTKFSWVDG